MEQLQYFKSSIQMEIYIWSHKIKEEWTKKCGPSAWSDELMAGGPICKNKKEEQNSNNKK